MSNRINEDKIAVRNAIDHACRYLLAENVEEFIIAPVIITFVIGEEMYKVANASLKDAFATSFKISPNVFDIKINDAGLESSDIVSSIAEILSSLDEQGKNYSDLRIAFIGFMDDPFFASENSAVIDSIRGAFAQLSDYGTNVKKTSFYGLFRQKKMGETNYAHAFEFINYGKDIWNNIYHMEIKFFANDITPYSQLIAINIISDDYDMVQKRDVDEYCWKSLYLSCLKMPEFITARVLREINMSQINGDNFDNERWSINIKKGFNQILDVLYQKDEFNCEQYVPLCFYDSSAVETAQTKHRSVRKISREEQPCYSQIVKDESTFDCLLDEIYGKIELDENKYEAIIEQILSSDTCIDPDTNKITEYLLNALNQTLADYNNQKAKVKQSINNGSLNQVEDYLKKTYEEKRFLFITDKKIEIINAIINQIKNSDILVRAVGRISKTNKAYTDILNELIINEYGGTLETFDIPALPKFNVNKPIVNILQDLNKELLRKIVCDKESVYQKLQSFLGAKYCNMSEKHRLGEVNGEYNNPGQIISTLLMVPSLKNDENLQTLINKHGGLNIAVNELYRENTFYILSSREYLSDRYIIRYGRG